MHQLSTHWRACDALLMGNLHRLPIADKIEPDACRAAFAPQFRCQPASGMLPPSLCGGTWSAATPHKVVSSGDLIVVEPPALRAPVHSGSALLNVCRIRNLNQEVRVLAQVVHRLLLVLWAQCAHADISRLRRRLSQPAHEPTAVPGAAVLRGLSA